MAQEKPQLKFERNPCIRFRENCATDGRTDVGQKSHTMTSADSLAELIKTTHGWPQCGLISGLREQDLTSLMTWYTRNKVMYVGAGAYVLDLSNLC